MSALSPLFLTLSVTLFATSPLSADDGFRCPSGRLVNVGDRMKQVQDRCGDPDSTDQRFERRKVSRSVSRGAAGYRDTVKEEDEVEVRIDEWSYDFGKRRFMRHLTFEDGRLTAIETGNYGSNGDR